MLIRGELVPCRICPAAVKEFVMLGGGRGGAGFALKLTLPYIHTFQVHLMGYLVSEINYSEVAYLLCITFPGTATAVLIRHHSSSITNTTLSNLSLVPPQCLRQLSCLLGPLSCQRMVAEAGHGGREPLLTDLSPVLKSCISKALILIRL